MAAHDGKTQRNIQFNPLQAVSHLGEAVGHVFSSLTGAARHHRHQPGPNRGISADTSQAAQTGSHAPSTGPVTKEALGRSTWLFLHTLAAQYPDQPDKQQRKDVVSLIDALTRIYPCADCAQHFQQVVRKQPPTVGSGAELRQWLCEVHNLVNERLQKPAFNCCLVDMRWGRLDCDDQDSCSLTRPRSKPNRRP